MNAEAWHAYAGALIDTDSIDRALEAWRRAVHLRPSFVEAVAFLSLAHSKRDVDRLAEALRVTLPSAATPAQ